MGCCGSRTSIITVGQGENRIGYEVLDSYAKRVSFVELTVASAAGGTLSITRRSPDGAETEFATITITSSHDTVKLYDKILRVGDVLILSGSAVETKPYSVTLITEDPSAAKEIQLDPALIETDLDHMDDFQKTEVIKGLVKFCKDYTKA